MPVGYSDGQRFSCVHVLVNRLKGIIYAQNSTRIKIHPQIPREQLKCLAKKISIGYFLAKNRLESGVEIPIHNQIQSKQKLKTLYLL